MNQKHSSIQNLALVQTGSRAHEITVRGPSSTDEITRDGVDNGSVRGPGVDDWGVHNRRHPHDLRQVVQVPDSSVTRCPIPSEKNRDVDLNSGSY